MQIFHEIKAMLEIPHAKLLIDLGHDYPDLSSRYHVLFLDFKSLTHVNQDFLDAQKDLSFYGQKSMAQRGFVRGNK